MRKLAVVLICAACAGAPRPPLALMSVDGNPQRQALGKIAGVAELGDAIIVFSDEGVTVLRAGAVAARDSGVHAWRPWPAVISAPDHAGQWVVAVDDDGHVRRVAALTSLEDIGSRYGLEGEKTLALAAVGKDGVALAGDKGLALADGEHITRFPGVRFSVVAGGKTGKIAGIAAADEVQIWDVARGQVRTFHVPGAAFVVFDAAGRCVVAGKSAIYVENDGNLERKLESQTPIAGLVASENRIWFAAGSELYVLENGVVSRTEGATFPAGAHLAAAAAGGVWITGDSQLTHVTVGAAGVIGSPEVAWQSQIQPIFGRVCSRCHLPGGSADVDLSSAHEWIARRDLIRQRVLVDKDMPPAGTTLPDADREAIGRWLGKP